VRPGALLLHRVVSRSLAMAPCYPLGPPTPPSPLLQECSTSASRQRLVYRVRLPGKRGFPIAKGGSSTCWLQGRARLYLIPCDAQ